MAQKGRKWQFRTNSDSEIDGELNRAVEERIDFYIAQEKVQKGAMARVLKMAVIQGLDGSPLPEHKTQQQIAALLKRFANEQRNLTMELLQGQKQQSEQLSRLLHFLQTTDLSQYRHNTTGRTMQDEVGDMLPEGFLSNLSSNAGRMRFDSDEDD